MAFALQLLKQVSPNVEFVSGKGTLYRQTWAAPATASNTAVHAAVTSPATGTTVVTTGITNPSTPRCVRVKGSASLMTGDVVVVGKNQFGEAKTDTIALNGSAAVDGVVAFSTVTRITIPAKVNTSGDTVSVGVGVAMGAARRLSEASCLYATVDGAVDSALPTVNTTNSTFVFATAPNGAKNFVVCFVHVDFK